MVEVERRDVLIGGAALAGARRRTGRVLRRPRESVHEFYLTILNPILVARHGFARM
jgi:hypothetical protein